MTLLRTTVILAIVIYAGYWLDSAAHRRRKELERKGEHKAIENWEGEGGNMVNWSGGAHAPPATVKG